MPDMLVKLYDVCSGDLRDERLKAEGVSVRRAMAAEATRVVAFVRERFGEGWASETAVALSRSPIACYIAVQDKQILGFACYDAAAKNFFGPTGVGEEHRKRGIGTTLLLACLNAMHQDGYGYAIIGWAGPVGYYEKAVGATVIPSSEPGMYRGML